MPHHHHRRRRSRRHRIPVVKPNPRTRTYKRTHERAPRPTRKWQRLWRARARAPPRPSRTARVRINTLAYARRAIEYNGYYKTLDRTLWVRRKAKLEKTHVRVSTKKERTEGEGGIRQFDRESSTELDAGVRKAPPTRRQTGKTRCSSVDRARSGWTKV